MLLALKRWLGSGAAPAADWSTVPPWAQARGYGCRVVQGAGFVVDARQGTAAPWRLEWGPSQRPYVEGAELRLRADLGLPPELHVAVMNRALQQRLESAVYQRYVQDVQTGIDEQTPPEMRWLVMFPKLPGSDVAALRERCVVVSSARPWALAWLGGALGAALGSLRIDAQQPLVLTIGRGRLTLRTALAEPEPHELERWLGLFETAVREARRAAAADDLLLMADDAGHAAPPAAVEAVAPPEATAAAR